MSNTAIIPKPCNYNCGTRCTAPIINDGDIAAIVPATNTIAKNIELVFLLILFYCSILKYVTLYYI